MKNIILIIIFSSFIISGKNEIIKPNIIFVFADENMKEHIREIFRT